MKFKKGNIIILCSLATFLFYLVGCKKFIEVDAPITSINTANVFSNDATAASVLTGIYTLMSKSNLEIAAGDITTISIFGGLSADELILFNINNTKYFPFYSNDLTNATSSNSYWPNLYNYIYTTNAAIEGLNSSASLTAMVKIQLLGEAKFIRALCYFYLVNLYGDCPLVLSTDYKVNTLLSRVPQAKVYDQIIQDLTDAQLLLSENFLKSDALTPYISNATERVRPTKWAATALLARAYLYTGKWDKAETEATTIINKVSLFSLTTLNNSFLKNSNETIWALQPVYNLTNSNTGEGILFVLPATGPNNAPNNIYLSNNVVNSFEMNDNRKSNWVNSVTVGGTTYYHPYKYKIGAVNTTTQEYSVVLRLAEQYLIRAEARAKQNKIQDAQSDLNTIRVRAGLPNSLANDQSSLLNAILQERRVELFTEWGHRWLDLKRVGEIDNVMSNVSATKGGVWETKDKLYPILLIELQRNPNLVQNPGY